MGLFDFISSIVKSVAWPAVVVFAILFLQKPIRELVASISEFSIGKDGFTGKWDRRAEQARAGILQSFGSGRSPPEVSSFLTKAMGITPPDSNAARISLAWRDLEETVRSRLERAGVKSMSLVGVPLIQEARARDLITEEQARSMLGLNAMRNLAIHSRSDEVNDARASEFLGLAEAMKTVFSITG
jgi:hypothetical protein